MICELCNGRGWVEDKGERLVPLSFTNEFGDMEPIYAKKLCKTCHGTGILVQNEREENNPKNLFEPNFKKVPLLSEPFDRVKEK